MDQNLLIEMLREVDLFPRNSTEHVALDTRVFHDPFSSNTLPDHVGYHPEIIRMVAESKPSWFHFFVRFVRRAVRLASEADVPAGVSAGRSLSSASVRAATTAPWPWRFSSSTPYSTPAS